MNPDIKRLNSFLKTLANFTDEQLSVAEPFVSVRHIAKGESFLRIGDVSSDFAFVISGLLRRYFVDAEGGEHNNYFAMENQLIGSYESLRTQRPSRFAVEALENSKVLVMKLSDHLTLIEKYPAWAEAGKRIVEWIAGYREGRESQFLAQSASERYAEFLSTYPELSKRVPQYHIASYLGVTPEGLSRLLKNRGSQPPK